MISIGYNVIYPFALFYIYFILYACNNKHLRVHFMLYNDYDVGVQIVCHHYRKTNWSISIVCIKMIILLLLKIKCTIIYDVYAAYYSWKHNFTIFKLWHGAFVINNHHRGVINYIYIYIFQIEINCLILF